MPSVQKTSPERAAKILREVPPHEAFYFYRAIDSPLNVSAKSLREFLDRVKSVEPGSLRFHAERQDFENWVIMLGDTDLANKIHGLKSSNLEVEALRTKLQATLRSRVDQLARLSMRIPR